MFVTCQKKKDMKERNNIERGKNKKTLEGRGTIVQDIVRPEYINR